MCSKHLACQTKGQVSSVRALTRYLGGVVPGSHSGLEAAATTFRCTCAHADRRRRGRVRMSRRDHDPLGRTDGGVVKQRREKHDIRLTCVL